MKRKKSFCGMIHIMIMLTSIGGGPDCSFMNVVLCKHRLVCMCVSERMYIYIYIFG